MYVKVEYLSSKGQPRYKVIAKDKESKVTIRGFANTSPVSFSVSACSVRGNNLGSVDISERPQTPAFIEVAKTITLDPDLGGIYVNWKNEFNTPVYIVLDYQAKNDSKKSGTLKIEIPANTESRQYLILSYGTDESLAGEECIVNVITEDEEENASEAKKFELTPLKAIKFPKKDTNGNMLWSFPGYKDSSNDTTIGYSSQEAGGEGVTPKGRVIALIDDNLDTFWHTAWKTSSAFPHFFILDLGEDKLISSVVLYRRQSNHGESAQKGQTFYTCSAAGALGSDPASWNWKDQGSYSFDVKKADAQSYRLTANPVGRYIKVYFGTENQGTGTFAMLAEIDVYGIDLD